MKAAKDVGKRQIGFTSISNVTDAYAEDVMVI